MLKPLIQLRKSKIYNVQTYQHLIEHLDAKTDLIAITSSVLKKIGLFLLTANVQR